MLTAYDIYDNYRLEGFRAQTVTDILKFYPYAVFTKKSNYNAVHSWLRQERIKEFDFIGSREPNGTIWFFADQDCAVTVGLKWM